MPNYTVKMPMRRLDPVTKQEKMEYARYTGQEGQVTEADRRQHRTSRIFHLENRRGRKFTLRIIGNSEYKFWSEVNPNPIVHGSMNDPVVPEITCER